MSKRESYRNPIGGMNCGNIILWEKCTRIMGLHAHWAQGSVNSISKAIRFFLHQSCIIVEHILFRQVPTCVSSTLAWLFLLTGHSACAMPRMLDNGWLSAQFLHLVGEHHTMTVNSLLNGILYTWNLGLVPSYKKNNYNKYSTVILASYVIVQTSLLKRNVTIWS